MNEVQLVDSVTPAQVASALAIAEAAQAVDGVPPLSDQTRLLLQHGGDESLRHLLVYRAHEVVGYGQLVGEPATAELLIHPRARRAGLGRALLERAIAATGGRLRVWAHGSLPGAAALAAVLGFAPVRELWQWRRSLLEPIPEPRFADDVTVRTFQVGHDEQAWLGVNARAFADHPEQGGLTLADLRNRESESWFDPAGFLLAERAGQLIGFHWTKIHPAREGESAHGEVYVLGVDPSANGTGLGTALTLAGLHLLADRGLSDALLYVDASNTAAVALYRKVGFSHWGTDTEYSLG